MRQYATFKLGEQPFGVDVLIVREINQQLEITPIQHAPECVKGLINLRGQIITVFDLGVRLNLEPRTVTRGSHIIVLKNDEELASIRFREGRDDLHSGADTVGLLVDDIGDVVESDEADIEQAPANIGRLEGRFIRGVLKQASDLLILLDVGELIDLTLEKV